MLLNGKKNIAILPEPKTVVVINKNPEIRSAINLTESQDIILKIRHSFHKTAS